MAGKNITIAGAVFNAVPSIDVPVSGGGTASFVEISDTTAQAADVAQGKYFYDAQGVKTEGTASGGGGASNVVTGTFTGSARGAMDVSLNYSGTGYPVAFVAYPKSGAYDPSSDFYNLVARYAIEYILLVKNVRSDVPAWDSSFTGGMFTYNVRYKNSPSSATAYNNNSRTDAKTLGNKNAATGGSGEITVRFKSSTVMSVYITNRDSYTVAEYGFYHGIEYEYCVIYSE